MKFPYLQTIEIEREAAKLLYSFEQRFGKIKGNAVPIEEIMENHLGLVLETVEEEADILGCLNINKKIVYINEAIFPDNINTKAGRYNFTLGHECAHWVLHAPVVLDAEGNHGCHYQQHGQQQSHDQKNSE